VEHFADRLVTRIERTGTPLCVGIDPRLDRLPAAVRKKALKKYGETLEGAAAAIEAFSLAAVDAVAELVPAVKVQNAFFEMYGAPGAAAFARVVAHAREKGLITISDAKRSDIGSTAEAYADAHLGAVRVGKNSLEPVGADAVTVNPYFGIDGVKPFIDRATERGRGVFVLAKTSNPSAGQVQDLANGGRSVAHHVADLVWEWGKDLLGARDYSLVGAVVGATWPEALRKLRAECPRAILLVPGYGAQGGSAADVATAFNEDGLGALVNASRSILYAFSEKRYAEFGEKRFEEAIRAAAEVAAKEIAEAARPHGGVGTHGGEVQGE